MIECELERISVKLQIFESNSQLFCPVPAGKRRWNESL